MMTEHETTMMMMMTMTMMIENAPLWPFILQTSFVYKMYIIILHMYTVSQKSIPLDI